MPRIRVGAGCVGSYDPKIEPVESMPNCISHELHGAGSDCALVIGPVTSMDLDEEVQACWKLGWFALPRYYIDGVIIRATQMFAENARQDSSENHLLSCYICCMLNSYL